MNRNVTVLGSIGMSLACGIGWLLISRSLALGAAGEATPPSQLCVSELPVSLDELYPPRAPQPRFTMSMVDLAAAMTTIAVDLSEQDVENAANGFARFKTVYAEAAELVPEWRDRYPGGPVQELGDALAGGDPEKVMAAFGAVGAVCSDCHRATMAAVQHLYHWPDPRAITASDPVTGEKVDFIRFMHQLDFSLTGVTADAVQGQVEASRRHFRDFRARFGILAEICQECHGTEERRYFTDATAHALVERLGASLANATPDLDAVTKAAAAVGHETCFRCHLVHIPAALARAQHR